MRLSILASDRRSMSMPLTVQTARNLLTDRVADCTAASDETVVRLPRRHPAAQKRRNVSAEFDLRGWSRA